MPSGGLMMPKLVSVRLRNFSLYSGRNAIDVSFHKPVFCLAGANGLGKSTFLQCLVYALTGVVRQPDYSFKGVEDLERDNATFAKRYFEGRVRGRDKDLADVQVTFQLGGATLTIQRSFADARIAEWTSSPSPILHGLSSNNIKDYQEAVCRLAGLKDFSQFIFLVHYVLAFDENRQLLFWNSDVLTQAVYLLVGWNPTDAAQADSLARQIDRVDSRVRNLQYDITQARNYIRELERDLDHSKWAHEPSSMDAVARHEALIMALESLEKDLMMRKERLSHLLAKISDTSAKQMTCRSQYDLIYDELLGSTRASRLKQHPVVRNTLHEQSCGLCGSTGDAIVARVEEVLSHEECPLCRSNLTDQEERKDDATLMAKLRELDKILMELEQNLILLQREREDTEHDLRTLRERYESIQAELAELESMPVIQSRRAGQSVREALPALIKSQLDLIQVKAKQKDEAIQERDRLKDQALRLQRQLQRSYQAAEEEFLPIFRNLAQKFMGLPVNIQMNPQTRNHRPELRFTLELEDSNRQYEHQLSESQRFFVDIALRMAFVVYVGRKDPNAAGFLLVDTPEGSLDIAYETNAGEMLAEFAGQGKQLILTANINSSGLVRTLAKECRGQRMDVQRMIDWTGLSSVQFKRYELFEASLDEIDRLLGEGHEH